MSLEDVVRAATTNPAGVAEDRSGEHAGSLAVGAPADIAIFELEVVILPSMTPISSAAKPTVFS
jgi:predicted amidohydrolase